MNTVEQIKAFQERLVHFREAASYAVDDAAEDIGSFPNTLNAIESWVEWHQTTPLSYEYVAALADLYGVKAEQLLGDYEIESVIP